jgi:hypothetical protein
MDHDQTTGITHKSRTRVFIFLTSLSPSVEKVVDFHEFSEVYKININVVFLVFRQCGS